MKKVVGCNGTHLDTCQAETCEGCRLAIYEKLSNCCSAPIHENTDICSECKEHCEGE